jgi:hypothetical protein
MPVSQRNGHVHAQPGNENTNRTGKILICHLRHEHDRVYTENLCDYFKSAGVDCHVFEFDAAGQRPDLLQCLNENTRAIIGYNSQLDHCWIGDENFVDVAAHHQIPVIHWLKDHPSAHWPEFIRSTAANSRFLLQSEFSRRYFSRCCLPDARTAWANGDGPNWRSRIDAFSSHDYINRHGNCLIPLNLRRVGGTLEDAQQRLRTLQPVLSAAVERAIELAQFDLSQPIESHLTNVLAQNTHELTERQFHFCVQIVEDIVQIRRRLKVFDVASHFSVSMQTDSLPKGTTLGSTATLSTDAQVNSMPETIKRIKSYRSVVSVSYANDMLHDRMNNGLNAGCVVIIEDTPTHRQLFEHDRNALLFRYDDDSLIRCFDIVCNRPNKACEIAANGFRMRDDPSIRFRGYSNILALA